MLRWLEGFESAHLNPVHHNRIYSSFFGSFTSGTGEGASEPGGNSVTSSDAVFTTPVLVGAAQNTWIVGIAFMADAATINSPDIPYVGIQNSDGEQIRFEFLQSDDPNGKPGGQYYRIRIMRGATELASSNELFLVNVSNRGWIYFEFKVTIDNSSGSFHAQYEFCQKPSVNQGGPTTLTWDAANTNVDTQNQSSTGADRVEISMATGSGLSRVRIDDIYIADGSGAKNNDFIGRIVVDGQKPSGDGDTVQWDLQGAALSTEDAWNEPVNSVEDDKRLSSLTNGQIHLCTVGGFSTIVGSTEILGVRQDLVGRMETSGDVDVAHIWRKTTGTPAQVASGTLNVDSTANRGSSVVLEDDPNTTSDWDAADLPSYQHGVRYDG